MIDAYAFCQVQIAFFIQQLFSYFLRMYTDDYAITLALMIVLSCLVKTSDLELPNQVNQWLQTIGAPLYSNSQGHQNNPCF